MRPLWRKSIACLCAASLPLLQVRASAVPAAVNTAVSANVDPKEAMEFFRRNGVIRGDDDVLKSYLGDNSRLTPIGEALFRSLRARYNPAEAVEALQPSFKKIREAGPYNAQRRESVERTFAALSKRFADLPGSADGGSLEGSYRWGALVEAYMSSLTAPAQAPAAEYRQMALPDGSGYEFWDSQGLAYRMNANRVLTYNRELQRQQRLMNLDRPRQVPFIPETGRYNVEMLEYQYWRLKNQHDDIVIALRIDRLVLLAGLLNKQIREERFYLETDALEKQLEEEARGKTYVHRGRTWNIMELVERRMRNRMFYIDGAAKAVQRFRDDMNLIKGGPTITDAQVQSLSLDERNAIRWLSLSVVSTQEYAIRNQMESLDPSSPDSQMLQEALRSSPFDAAMRQRYSEQGARLRARLERLQGRLSRNRQDLLGADYSGSLDLIQADLGWAQRELTEIGADYSLYVEVPSGAFSAAAESGRSWSSGQLGQPWGEGWNIGNWGVRAWGEVNRAFGTKHGRNFERVAGQLPAYTRIATMIAGGDMAGARRAVIAMNPDAASRFEEVRLTGGGDTRITDPLRIASSLRSNRMDIAAVQTHNKWARTAASFITWTAALALSAPLITGALGVTVRIARGAAELLTKVPAIGRLVALPVRLVEHTAMHLEARLVTLNPARSEIPAMAQSNLAARYLYSSGIRFVNAGGRQASFTALSGVISTGFTTLQHGFAGRDSQFTDLGSAAMEGFTSGVVWANDSFHPALGYVGVPSSAFEGIRYVAPVAESLATRGVLGNLSALADAAAMRVAGRTLIPKAFNLEAFASGEWAIKAFGQNFAGRAASGLSQFAGFQVAMADQVAKYALFSHGVGILARNVSYANGLDAAALPPSAAENGPDGTAARLDREGMELERRIKRSNQAATAWEASPIWLAIPTFPAHVALQGAVYQRAAEGMKQYDEAGRTHEYANAYEGQELSLLRGRPKAPLSQRMFDWSWRTQESSDIWVVTKEARSEGIRKALNEEVGAVGGKLEGVNPMRFYEIMELPDNARLKNKLAVNDEVRELARRNLAEALVANPTLAKDILSAPLGTNVPGFGVVRYGTRREIAATLHMADNILGVKVPKDVLAKLGPAHERYVQSDRLPKQPAADAMAALREIGRKAPGVDKAGDFIADAVAQWREGKGPQAGAHYTELIPAWRQEMRARVERGEMTAKESRVVERFFDAIEAIDKRFSSFNNPTTVRSIMRDVIDSVKTEFGSGSKAAQDFIGKLERGFAEWKPTEGRRVADPEGLRGGAKASDGSFEAMVKGFEQALREAKGLTPTEARVLKEALGEIKNSPWAVRDKGGSPLPGWRPEQFESFMTAIGMVMRQGRGGEPIRLFQMLKTGGGKTMLTYEGLLPFAEADAAFRKMEVAFLTVQSNLEAQARADYFAYKKLDSRLTFDTYEGLKTKIAEGKTKGVKALHKYWILGDEMDGAALQPALTIGEVTGRISRVSSVLKRIVEMDESLLSRLENTVQGRANDSIRQARLLKWEAGRLADLPNAKRLNEAADRVLRSAEEYQRASGPEARLRAERGMRGAMEELKSLTATTPTAQAESILSMRRAIERLERNLVEPPAGSRGDATLLEDMQSAFRRQRNILELAGSEEGLQRLMVEARTARLQGEQKIARLEREIQAARDSGRPGSTQAAAALEAELALVKAETRLATRFEGVDPGARLLSLTEKAVSLERQIAAGEGGPRAQSKLDAVEAEIRVLKRDMPPERVAGHEQHRALIRESYDIGRQMAEVDAQVVQALREGKPVQALRGRLEALEGQRATQRARIQEKAAELGSGAADGAFGPGLQRLRIVSGRLLEAKGRAEQLRESGKPDAALEAEVGSLAREKARLEKLALGRARRLFEEAGDDIVRIVKEGKPGFEGEARRMLEQRRRLLESFGGDENPIYSVYREMKADMEPVANNRRLLHPDPEVHNKAVDLLLKRIDGENFFVALPSIMKMTYEVFSGRPVTVPVDVVGLTRIHSAKLLRALFADPIMPPGQRQNLFWNFFPSLLSSKWVGGRSSWVRAELLKLVQAYHENPAGIRFDGITGRVNVVHNGQWFEAMDNESRRFWELEYGTDLTLPYTHRSLSTIRDLTTDKRANFISFSGTAGSKFRAHLEGNEVRLAGKGSVAPEGVRMDLRATASEKIAAIRQAILESSALSRDHVVVRSYDNMPPAVKAEVQAYLDARPPTKGKDAAVVRISELPSQATRDWLTNLRATQPESTNLVVLSVSDTRVLKLVRNYMIRSGLVKENEIAMVFSDAEFLRLNRPDARVHEQMNLEGLNDGTVRVLILDTRVGGRGLDLNYKGDKSPTAANPFRGYSNYRMLIVDPHEMSAVHLLQAQGRIDLGRVLPGAFREFSLVMDVKAVQGEAIFRQMFRESPFFLEMRKDPALEAFARSRGATTLDWALVHEYIRAREAGATPEGQALANKYRAEVQQYLERRQLEVEEDQLRSSSVSDDPSASPGRFPGLGRLAPGR